MKARAPILPPTLAPRGLRREEAAAYVGVGASTFDAMVRDGRMPGPKVVGARRVWDLRALDRAFDALPSDGPDELGDGNVWDGAL